MAFGFVFWLLFDPIQGAYDLRDADDWAIRDAFIAIGVSAAAMWVGVMGQAVAVAPLACRHRQAAAGHQDRWPVDTGLFLPRHVQLRVGH